MLLLVLKSNPWKNNCGIVEAGHFTLRVCQCVCVMCVFNAQVHVCLWVQCRSPKGCCSTRRQLLFPVQIVKKNVIENVVPIIVATKHLLSTCTVYYTQSILYCTVYCAQSILYCTVYCTSSLSSTYIHMSCQLVIWLRWGWMRSACTVHLHQSYGCLYVRVCIGVCVSMCMYDRNTFILQAVNQR